jgi:hypothetical protein
MAVAAYVGCSWCLDIGNFSTRNNVALGIESQGF